MTIASKDVGALKPAEVDSENRPDANGNALDEPVIDFDVKAEVSKAEKVCQEVTVAETNSRNDIVAEQAEEAKGNQEMDYDVETENVNCMPSNGEPSNSAALEKRGFPLSLGPKTFTCVESARSFFKKLITEWPANFRLNEYEHKVVGALLHDCHPRAKAKIGVGVAYFKVRRPNVSCPRKCLFLCRKDGSEEDFSYLKCLSEAAGEDMVKSVRDEWKGPRNGQFSARGRGRGRGRGGGRGRGARGGRGGRNGKVSKR